MTNRTKEILAQRGAEYGDYATMSTTIQAIKREIHNWDTHGIPAPHMEALDMIATKIGRILTGNHDNVDSWDDIAGYATLVANRIRKNKDQEQQSEEAPRPCTCHVSDRVENGIKHCQRQYALSECILHMHGWELSPITGRWFNPAHDYATIRTAAFDALEELKQQGLI